MSQVSELINEADLRPAVEGGPRSTKLSLGGAAWSIFEGGRPRVTAANVRFGCAAVSASSRTQAAIRWRGFTREYVTVSRVSSATPDTVPRSVRPSGSATFTSTEVVWDVTATDRGVNVPVSCSPVSGSLFYVGTTTVTCSAEPVFGGPVYFIRNLLYHVPGGGAFKFNAKPAGILVYHNTLIGEQTARDPYSNAHYRNNLFLGRETPDQGVATAIMPRS